MNKSVKLIIYTVLVFFTISSIYPLFHVFITSFKQLNEYINNGFLPSTHWVWDNYRVAIDQGNLLYYFRNNLILIPTALLFYLFVCITAGFAFGRLRFPFRLSLFLLVLFLMIFPQMLLSMQLFQLCSKLHLTNSYLGLILVWTAYFAPFGTYIMATFFSSLPYEIIESARIDGAGTWKILTRIALPIAYPMLGIIIIIAFQSMWNELPFSLLLLQKMEMRTVTLGIAMIQGQYGIPATVQSAVIMIASIIPMMVFVFFQKYIATGSFAGAIKG
ncbi:multiple sugar transport system permease protein/raffinose/stachyose/melibiose transport system permease protein [Hydrogenispora ethanolica]|jgi:ABC-type glycerol-3-phosphate transport system permease component|uniref:Multiple sugar transport system permease protein/raffinose/stachyose/melibiose transport system permease protein n=1 Tax=Hydrogenispora ethanolica TaxID=1082276 RepID=A0A4V2QD07_HYDET|nr:multiple sugar transport system permease protein/raffinose/stachyose/melibiose transport system permease protein [Hydrogenispora ethanolica]